MRDEMPDRSVLEAAVRRWDPAATLIGAHPLEGGISAQMVRLEVVCGGARHNLVLRRHGRRDLAHRPRIAATEYALLQCLAQRGLAVPAPRYLDESCVLLPTPWLLLDHLPGKVRWEAAAPVTAGERIADWMLALHALDSTAILAEMAQVPTGGAPAPPLPDRLEVVLHTLTHPPAVQDDSLDEPAIRAALLRHGPPQTLARPALLHGDLWPGNILWQGAAICGVLDWSEAAVGDPLADLGNSRLELLWAYGEAGLEALTAHYLTGSGLAADWLPWWDLVAALAPCGRLQEWGIEPKQEARMRRLHHQFARRAMERLATGPA